MLLLGMLNNFKYYHDPTKRLSLTTLFVLGIIDNKVVIKTKSLFLQVGLLKIIITILPLQDHKIVMWLTWKALQSYY
jgi:hypothetical protein